MAPSLGQRIKSPQLSLPLMGQGTWFLLSRKTRHFWKNYFCGILLTHHFNFSTANPLLLKNISIETLRVKLLTSNKGIIFKEGVHCLNHGHFPEIFLSFWMTCFSRCYTNFFLKKYLVNHDLAFNSPYQTAF